MVNEDTQNMWIGHFVHLIRTVLFSRCMIEGSKVALLCKLWSWLLVSAAGSLHLDCQHHAPRPIRSRGHPFGKAQEENARSKFTYKKAIRNLRWIRKKNAIRNLRWITKPDRGKWPGVRPTNNTLRVTRSRYFVLVTLYSEYCIGFRVIRSFLGTNAYNSCINSCK